jgi:hypothetical protein
MQSKVFAISLGFGVPGSALISPRLGGDRQMSDETLTGANSERSECFGLGAAKGALSEQTRTLVRQELRAHREGKKAGVGVGMFGGAWVLGLYAAGALTACVVLALNTALAGWLAALIVAAAYGPSPACPCREG